jgi:hypothetical protein
MSKAKFLFDFKSETQKMQPKDTKSLTDILEKVDAGIALPSGHINSFSNTDLIQILKEINHVACSGSMSPQYQTLVNHEATVRILFLIITKDYVIDDSSRDLSLQ